jgi:very-short-patch-repair endonuclease
MSDYDEWVGDGTNFVDLGTALRVAFISELCESPIEKVALSALVALMPWRTAVVTSKKMLKGGNWEYAIIPQMPCHGYRLDFGVLNRKRRMVFALECDGKAFHDGTSNQLRDNQRSVNLWKQGVLVRRVRGSALVRNPIEALRPFVDEITDETALQREYRYANLV